MLKNIKEDVTILRPHHHLFFHSLLVETEKAFHCREEEFETWMITVDEFRTLLKSLYRRNYILVRLRDLADNKVCLPAGKIPLVLSFDDVNYYDYMKGNGFAEKLLTDPNGDAANVYRDANGNEVVGKMFDGPAILDEFIRLHPDFSYSGAHGILAVTGKEGVLGWHDPVREKEQICSIVRRLKEIGWEFACHSFGHSSAVFKTGPLQLKEAVEDTEKWLSQTALLVGQTDIYISPFGFDVSHEPAFFSYLKKKGFRFFCGVENLRKLEIRRDCVISNRINIDGFLFAHRSYELECYYADLKEVLSPQRLHSYTRYGMTGWDLGMHGIVCSKMPTVYLWGGLGEIITEKVIREKKAEYPDRYTKEYCDHLRQYADKGVRGFDCSGLIKNYLMGGIPHFSYQSELDLNSSGLLSRAPKKGTIDTLPEERGICLYMPGHVGIYLGNGWVAEATRNTSFGDGVVQTALKARKWTHWFFCIGIGYGTEI